MPVSVLVEKAVVVAVVEEVDCRFVGPFDAAETVVVVAVFVPQEFDWEEEEEEAAAAVAVAETALPACRPRRYSSSSLHRVGERVGAVPAVVLQTDSSLDRNTRILPDFPVAGRHSCFADCVVAVSAAAPV